MTWAEGAEVEEALQDAIAAMFATLNRESQLARGDRLYALTPSYVGGCTRQAAHRAAGTEPSDPELAVDGEHRAARMGIWIHSGALPALAAELARIGGGGAPEVEYAVRVLCGGLVLEGSADLWWEQAGLLLDLKTLFISGVENLVRRGDKPRWRHRVQVGTYALGRQQMAAADGGQRPRWVAWPYMERTSGRTRVYVEAWTREFAIEVFTRLEEIQAAAADPDAVRPEADGPGLSAECDGCSWLRRCWGPGAVPGKAGAQASLARTSAAVQRFGEEWLEASRQMREAKTRRDFAGAVIGGGDRKPGVYGDIEWCWQGGGKIPDLDAARQLLADLGFQMPTKEKRPHLAVRRKISDS